MAVTLKEAIDEAFVDLNQKRVLLEQIETNPELILTDLFTNARQPMQWYEYIHSFVGTKNRKKLSRGQFDKYLFGLVKKHLESIDPEIEVQNWGDKTPTCMIFYGERQLLMFSFCEHTYQDRIEHHIAWLTETCDKYRTSREKREQELAVMQAVLNSPTSTDTERVAAQKKAARSQQDAEWMDVTEKRSQEELDELLRQRPLWNAKLVEWFKRFEQYGYKQQQ